MIHEAKASEEQVTRHQISVVVERRLVEGSRWETEHSEVVGVISGRDSTDEEFEVKRIHGDNNSAQYLWSGFFLELFQDDAESYYFNLRGDEPKVFVICRRDDEDGLKPFLVTLSYDEASSYMEVEDDVFSVPIPQDVYEWVERYVVNNYEPQPLKKRKRIKWVEEAGRRD
ncbi:MAG: hypothetical protein DRQ37_04995 [Gammaproteobacteria bacterium]|nr:MAG: hypothetical protein DRQ37_04995 [Gammaproteobacteria bacterium]